MARYIFITGGVVSSLGKGLASAALGALLQARGFTVRLRKLDPYLNVDPGTMSPFEHGEVFVTDDGAETDLDLGHYERFTGVSARKTDSVSSGRIYSNVLEKERRGEYLGKTIQVIPHVTNEIKDFLAIGEDEVDFMLCEIGGTRGLRKHPFAARCRGRKVQWVDERVVKTASADACDDGPRLGLLCFRHKVHARKLVCGEGSGHDNRVRARARHARRPADAHGIDKRREKHRVLGDPLRWPAWANAKRQLKAFILQRLKLCIVRGAARTVHGSGDRAPLTGTVGPSTLLQVSYARVYHDEFRLNQQAPHVDAWPVHRAGAGPRAVPIHTLYRPYTTKTRYEEKPDCTEP